MKARDKTYIHMWQKVNSFKLSVIYYSKITIL